MMAVQGPLAAMSPRTSPDSPAPVIGPADSFASFVEGGQLAELPKDTTAVKEIEAQIVEMVEDTGDGLPISEDIDEFAAPLVPLPSVAPVPAPVIFPGMVPLDAAAAPLSDSGLPLSADEPPVAAAALPAIDPGGAKDDRVPGDLISALPRGDRVGGLGAFRGFEAMAERDWTAGAASADHGGIESAGTVEPVPGVMPAIDGLSSPPAVGGSAQPVAPKGQSAEPVPLLPSAEPPDTVAGTPPVPVGRQGPETEAKKRHALDGVRIEHVSARGSIGSTVAVETPAVASAQTKGDPVLAAPGPDRAAMDARLSAPATGPVEMRSDLTFSTALTQAAHASAAEAPPPPRSPLVQAVLDRIFPLSAVVGETVVRLNPHGLGIIEVVLQDGRNGALDVALRVQNPLVLEAMRQERDTVAQTFSAAQGAAAGSLSMDLFQSGTGQRGAGPGLPAGRAPAGEAGQEDVPEDPQSDRPAPKISRADRVNIVT